MKWGKSSNLEETLWLQLRGAGLAGRCTREYRFAPPRRWRFDFAFLHCNLAVECEGGSWVNGAHGRGQHFEEDCEKYNAAVEHGWFVLRYTMSQIRSGQALLQIERVLKQGEWPELPSLDQLRLAEKELCDVKSARAKTVKQS